MLPVDGLISAQRVGMMGTIYRDWGQQRWGMEAAAERRGVGYSSVKKVGGTHGVRSGNWGSVEDGTGEACGLHLSSHCVP